MDDPGDRLRNDARARFDAGDFGAASALYRRAFDAGDRTQHTLDALLLLRAGDPTTIAGVLTAFLDDAGPRLAPTDRLRWASELMDAAAAGADADAQRSAALRLVEAATAAGDAGWASALFSDRTGAVDAAFADPLDRLLLCELLAFAPPVSGYPARAAIRAEAIGHESAADGVVARAAERTLHGMGQREAAYRVERARRHQRGHAPPSPGPEEGGDATLGSLVVVVVGGHAPLRALVRRDLARDGAAVRVVPSAWEATRRGREVTEQLAGADVAVIVGRLVAHSTVAQVKQAAARLGVPVVTAETAAASAVRRALARHIAGRGGAA